MKHGVAIRLTTLTILGSLAACGYTVGSGLAGRGVRTVSLQVVGNESYRQRLEVDLGRALSRELPVTTDLRLADRRDADATLQVVINDVRERTLVSGNTLDPVREGAFEAAVTMRLIDRNGSIVIERRLLDRTEFRSPIGEDLTSARGELIEDLARKVALALESDF